MKDAVILYANQKINEIPEGLNVNNLEQIALSVVQRLRNLVSLEEVQDIISTNFVMGMPSERNTGMFSHKPTPWISRKQSEKVFTFWGHYKVYLDAKNLSSLIPDMNYVTNEIMDHLIDPTTPGYWSKKGLVIGNVQSGKTGNYIGLINKAADAGFKVIIVLAGRYNDLRRQTNERIDEGFYGHKTSNFNNIGGNRIGVGIYENHPGVNAYTTSDWNGDFNATVLQKIPLNFNAMDPKVFVIKKNSAVLGNIIRALANAGEISQNDGYPIVRNIPLLVIDDEADDASINVNFNNDNTDSPSAINARIRALLSLFEQNAYVGYTATPYANVFIQPNKEDEEALNQDILNLKAQGFRVQGDLYPENFIFTLDAGPTYIGPNQLFGLEASFDETRINETGLSLIKEIEDGEVFDEKAIPDEIPESLKEAILEFILSTAIRCARGQKEAHNSMLIHVSRLTAWHNAVSYLVLDEFTSIKEKIQNLAGNKLLEEKMKKLFEKDYGSKTMSIQNNYGSLYGDLKMVPWNEIKTWLNHVVSKIEVRALHSGAQDGGLNFPNQRKLDYFNYEKQADSDNNGLYVIAVGGNTLSRGLTLEGLTISYFYRSTSTYDTLMQMGRWFGYRNGYIDLCRLHITSMVKSRFENTAIADYELRELLKEACRQGKTPRDFEQMVRISPGMLPTSRNKFGGAARSFRTSFANTTIQTTVLHKNNDDWQMNYDSTINMFSKLGNKKAIIRNGQTLDHCLWECNYPPVIANFIGSFKASFGQTDAKVIEKYINKKWIDGEINNWKVVLINNSKYVNNNNMLHDFNIEGLDKIGLTLRSSNNRDFYSRPGGILSGHDESLDLTESEYHEALEATIEAAIKKGNNIDNIVGPSSIEVRKRRDPKTALLILYPISNNKEERMYSEMPLMGCVLSFPNIQNDTPVEYMATWKDTNVDIK